jgi:hypothetical protein
MEPTKRELLVEETHYKEVELQPLNSEKIDFPKSKKNPLAALYYNGTFSPVHAGHGGSRFTSFFNTQWTR